MEEKGLGTKILPEAFDWHYAGAWTHLFKDIEYYNNIDIIIPLGYIDFISYLKYSKGMITDSGGVQCEACYLNTPTLTLRPTTEHQITLDRGNKLIDIGGIDKDNFVKGTEPIPSEWDGQAAQRIAEIL